MQIVRFWPISRIISALIDMEFYANSNAWLGDRYANEVGPLWTVKMHSILHISSRCNAFVGSPKLHCFTILDIMDVGHTVTLLQELFALAWSVLQSQFYKQK